MIQKRYKFNSIFYFCLNDPHCYFVTGNCHSNPLSDPRLNGISREYISIMDAISRVTIMMVQPFYCVANPCCVRFHVLYSVYLTGIGQLNINLVQVMNE